MRVFVALGDLGVYTQHVPPSVSAGPSCALQFPCPSSPSGEGHVIGYNGHGASCVDEWVNVLGSGPQSVMVRAYRDISARELETMLR